ncbi:indole-3-glycerol-phosphate synthase [Methanosphaera sp.]|jgi:indole-3-glycerol phosphate synthase|uniref:indole-3-glycerol-phosphate synthase n=2 Tax=Methanosphaera TaxID=2316 RepID=UPI003D94930A
MADNMNVVEEIVKNKKKTLTELKKTKSTSQIRKEAIDYVSTKNNKFRFQEILKDKNSTKLIAEYKPASPSQGDISTLKPEDVIPLYDKNNVDMISVLTEESYFKSNLNNFKKATTLTEKPILRKDFVIDKYMLYEAAANNASAALLITGVCPDIEDYLNTCYDLGLDAIVECHTLDDIEQVVDYNPKIIGVNNRNFNDLSINLETTKNLREYVPNYLISESGVKTLNDAEKLKSYGADALLIGTSLLKNNNDTEIVEFINKLDNILKS